MEKKKKNNGIVPMVIISILIIVLGIIGAVALYSDLTSEIARNAGAQFFIDSFDIVAISGKAGNAGAAVISALIVVVSIILVIIQWIGYGITRAIKKLLSNDK